MARKRKDEDDERLRALIQEATVDCYQEYEEHLGLVNMIEEHVVCPFPAKIIGEDVEVVQLRGPEAGFGMCAICRYKGREYNIDINSLEWGKKKPRGFEWIQAYQLWLKSVS